MKRLFMLTLICFVCVAYTIAQESKFVGTWKGLLNGYYTDYKDKKIVMYITQEDNDYQVRIKECNLNDTLDCHNLMGVYDIKAHGNTLEWFWKSSRKIEEDENEYINYGAVYSEGKLFGSVKYSGGVLYYKTNYWNYWQLYDKCGRLVHTVDEENKLKVFIQEAVLYRDNNNW